MLFAIWNDQLFPTLAGCVVQEGVDAPGRQKNHPPKAARFDPESTDPMLFFPINIQPDLGFFMPVNSDIAFSWSDENGLPWWWWAKVFRQIPIGGLYVIHAARFMSKIINRAGHKRGCLKFSSSPFIRKQSVHRQDNRRQTPGLNIYPHGSDVDDPW